jgi:hypothetical protein
MLPVWSMAWWEHDRDAAVNQPFGTGPGYVAPGMHRRHAPSIWGSVVANNVAVVVTRRRSRLVSVEGWFRSGRTI